jgi:hypothetical protein
MIEIASSSATKGAGAPTALDTLAQRVAQTAASQGKSAQSGSGRTVGDSVDLSEAARIAAEYKVSAGADGKKPADQLAESLKQARAVTDSFAAKLRAGRGTDNSATDFNAVVREEVAGIMQAGKPSDLISRIVKRLFG